MPAHSVSKLAHQFDTSLPFTRKLGALASNTGLPNTMAVGWAIEAFMNAGMKSAGC